jgi:alcohol dehydrogenase
MENVGTALAKMARGVRPVIDSVIEMADFRAALDRIESRRIFGKIVMRV